MYIIATFCLLGLATAQTVTDITSCITKENNLRMECNFNPIETPSPTCKFTQGDKIVASTYEKQDPTYKNRANITMMDKVCEMSLTGLPDNPQEFKCTIKQTVESSKVATVDKKTTAKCSGISVLLQEGTGLFLVLMTLPLLLSELI
ncbi:thy-1 membrane glycoprotein [Alosa sapidissima]|uniref:thy-1 membrane glycoprotein n=1 Tax=Alosa sapidissima TaxID=34773 RepID=UPI001C081A6F|nr:thy-1 membrane glycoprotein [Alosa sapidissima]